MFLREDGSGLVGSHHLDSKKLGIIPAYRDIYYSLPVLNGMHGEETTRQYLEECFQLKSYYDDKHEDYFENYANLFEEENPTA